MTLYTKTHVLHGNWRRRTGTKTDAHLYPAGRERPICQKRIPVAATVSVHNGEPCTDCLVAAITER